MKNISLYVSDQLIPTKQNQSVNPEFDFTPEEITRVINTGSSYERTILLLEDDANHRELIAGEIRDHLVDLITFDDALGLYRKIATAYYSVSEVIEKLNDNQVEYLDQIEVMLDLYQQLEEQMRWQELSKCLQTEIAQNTQIQKIMKACHTIAEPERMSIVIDRMHKQNRVIHETLAQANAMIRVCLKTIKQTGCYVPTQIDLLQEVYDEQQIDRLKEFLKQKPDKWLSAKYHFIPKASKTAYNKLYYNGLNSWMKAGFSK